MEPGYWFVAGMIWGLPSALWVHKNLSDTQENPFLVPLVLFLGPIVPIMDLARRKLLG